MMQPPTATDVAAAEQRIASLIRRTPVIEIDGSQIGADQLDSVWLKLEYLQHSGSFKARGASNFLASEPISDAGVVAASGGNHGAAVAWAARERGLPASIFVPTISSPVKVDRLRQYGAEVHQVGAVYSESLTASLEYQRETGATSVHAYNHPVVMAGAGTCGLEFAAQANGLDTMLVATGGGGLAGGIACSVPDLHIVCCETETTTAFASAKAAGHPVDVEVSGIAADALGATSLGELPWAALKNSGASSVLVTDDDVRTTLAWLWDTFRIIVEPSAAVAPAALLTGAYRAAEGERVGVLLCGANTSVEVPT